MRRLSLVFVAAMLLVTGNILANESRDNPTNKLSTQIGELLENNYLTVGDVDLTAQVRFTLNYEGEIVVLSVDTDNERLKSFVKGRLNYKKVSTEGVEEGKMFTVPIRITS